VRTFNRITQRPDVLGGRATIRGLRISVAHVVKLVASGMTPAQIVDELPELEEQDVRQALVYAAALAQDESHLFARDACAFGRRWESRRRPSIS
jgi:uncharacterized protein (DUF433 family)